MKKLTIALAMVLCMGLVANVALSDETVPFPFWQHGSQILTFWSIANTHPTSDVTVTIEMLSPAGVQHCATTSTIAASSAWQPGTYEDWYQNYTGFPGGNIDGTGFGLYKIDVPGTTADFDCVHVWAAVLAVTADSQPGYTIINPGNPYGIPGI